MKRYPSSSRTSKTQRNIRSSHKTADGIKNNKIVHVLCVITVTLLLLLLLYRT